MIETVVSSWFADVKQLMLELKVKDSSAQIWNCDESGLQQHFIQSRVISETGQPCYQVTYNEMGETTTVLACFNAFGEFCPPTAIDLLCSADNDSLKVAVGYLLKTACEVMKGVYLIENNDLLANYLRPSA